MLYESTTTGIFRILAVFICHCNKFNDNSRIGSIRDNSGLPGVYMTIFFLGCNLQAPEWS